MRVIYWIIILSFSFQAFSINITYADIVSITKSDNFSIQQDQEYTSLYHKKVLVKKWKNEGYSCDKEGGYTNNDLANAKVCIADELSLKPLGKNWYSFQVLYKNYPEYYLYHIQSKTLYSYSAFEKVLQKGKGSAGLYYLFRGNQELFDETTQYESLVLLRNNGRYEEIYKNVKTKSRLISYELLLNKKIRLQFQNNDIVEYKIITIK